jgi:ribosomal protein S12 methylthiotransferase accessory factor
MARNLGSAQSDPPFLQVARRAAEKCGVTRLADVTDLDRLGLPVWQAIRPLSRALSVHQGKSLRQHDAQIGALCEAIESHSAEQVAADGPHCALTALPPQERLACPGDVLLDRGQRPDWDKPRAWCAATDFATGGTIYLPHAFVSLDFRTGSFSGIERSSNGIGAGPDERHALTTALMELVERDALGRWPGLSLVWRILARVDPETIPFRWFQNWRERLAACGATVDIFHIETITGAPAFRCAIDGTAAFDSGSRLAVGSAAHTDPETALAKAFAEAAQTRLTLIAGSRDDLLFGHYRHSDQPDEDRDWPPGRPWRDWPPVADPIGWTIDRLVERGYRQVLVKRLDPGDDGVAVVKAFVPGLGMLGRARRVPA